MKFLYSSLLFLGSFLFFTGNALPQQAVIDSLEFEISTHFKKDTTRVNNLDHLAFLYYRKDLKKAIAYMEESEALAKELNYAKGMGNSLYTRGVIEISQSNFDEAIMYFEKAAQLYATHGLKKSISACYNGVGAIYTYQGNYKESSAYYEKAYQNDIELGVKKNIPDYVANIGNNFMRTGNYPEAVANFKNALELYTESNHTLGMSTCLKNLASVYQSQSNYPLALEYNNKALLLGEKIKDSSGISVSLNNISIIYKSQKKYDKALEMLKKSLVIQKELKNNIIIAATKNNIASILIKKEDYPGAIEVLKESLALNRKINVKDQTSDCLNNLGKVYVSLKEYEKAFEYYEEAKNINLEIENQEGLCLSYLGIAGSFLQQKKYEDALTNILKSIEISEKLNLLAYKKDAKEVLSEIYENMGEYRKALASHQQFKILNDSLFNKENIEKITQLEYEYKYKQELDEASLRELKLTKTVNDTSQNLEKSQRNLLLGVIAFLAMLLLLGGIIFFLKLRNQKAKTDTIAIEQKLLRLQMTPHFIFNSLSVLQGMILNKEDKKAVTYLSKFSKLLRITLENSRDKMVPLHQELEAINNYLELQNLEENVSYEYSIVVDKTIDTTIFSIPPMLIQPFIENAIEHAFEHAAENRNIAIHLKHADHKLICTIADNGVGVAAHRGTKRKDKTSLATTITSERLKMLSKDFNVEASLTVTDRSKYNEQGTLVTIVIPYKIETPQ